MRKDNKKNKKKWDFKISASLKAKMLEVVFLLLNLLGVFAPFLLSTCQGGSFLDGIFQILCYVALTVCLMSEELWQIVRQMISYYEEIQVVSARNFEKLLVTKLGLYSYQSPNPKTQEVLVKVRERYLNALMEKVDIDERVDLYYTLCNIDFWLSGPFVYLLLIILITFVIGWNLPWQIMAITGGTILITRLFTFFENEGVCTFVANGGRMILLVFLLLVQEMIFSEYVQLHAGNFLTLYLLLYDFFLVKDDNFVQLMSHHQKLEEKQEKARAEVRAIMGELKELFPSHKKNKR